MKYVGIPQCNNPHYEEMQQARKYQEHICNNPSHHILQCIPAEIFKTHHQASDSQVHPLSFTLSLFNWNSSQYVFMLALFNDLCMGILHCDVSQNNTMLRIAKLDQHNVVSNWPKANVGDNGYIKRASLSGN